jgi:8-oxo-dGTP pyrophosphatase MutT (NUDIX family)
MAKDKYQVSLKVFFKDGKGRVLFLRASSKGSYAGYYDVPGGRIEDTEFHAPLMDILRREVVEELGEISFEIDPKPVLISRDEIGPNKETRVIYIFYEGKYLSGEIKTSDEHEGAIWEYPGELDVERHIKPIHREALKKYLISKNVSL